MTIQNIKKILVLILTRYHYQSHPLNSLCNNVLRGLTRVSFTSIVFLSMENFSGCILVACYQDFCCTLKTSALKKLISLMPSGSSSCTSPRWCTKSRGPGALTCWRRRSCSNLGSPKETIRWWRSTSFSFSSGEAISLY